MADLATIAALLLIMIGLPGVTVNLLNTAFIVYSNGPRTPFDIICATHSVANLIVISVLTFYGSPTIYFSLNLEGSFFCQRIVQLIWFGWFFSIYSQFFQAINRFLAINFAVLYKHVFTATKTKIYMVILIIFTSWHYFVQFIDGCHFKYYRETMSWYFEETECGDVLGFYADIIPSSIVLLTSVVLDTITAFRVIKFIKKTSTRRRHFTALDIRFFIQSCITNAIYLVTIFVFYFYHIIIAADDYFGTFFATTLFLELSHSLDGLIMLLFNKQFHSHISTSYLHRDSSLMFTRTPRH